jgi:hypothetical protein
MMPPQDIDYWLIMGKDGITFREFCIKYGAEKEAMVKFTFLSAPEDLNARARDNDKSVAHLARANWLLSKAQGYATKARGVIWWNLKKQEMTAAMCDSVSKAYLADFEEEAGDWKAIIDSLQERLWTGRKDVEREARQY